MKDFSLNEASRAKMVLKPARQGHSTVDSNAIVAICIPIDLRWNQGAIKTKLKYDRVSMVPEVFGRLNAGVRYVPGSMGHQ